MVKSVFVSFLCMLLSLEFAAQINVGPRVELETRSLGKFEEVHLDRLKNSKTYFVYKDSDLYHLESLSKSLKEVWHYSELELISFDEFRSGKYKGNYSFFTIDHLRVILKKYDYPVGFFDFCFLHLWMKKEDETLSFCRIELQPAAEVYSVIAQSYSDTTYNGAWEYIYKRATIHNWHLTHLKTALQYVDRKLFEAKEHKLYDAVVKENLSVLKNDTLYVPDYVRVKYGVYPGTEHKRKNLNWVFRKYKHPYRLVNEGELFEISQSSGGTAIYLNWVKSSNHKYISVFDGKTSELLYNDASLGSNLRVKDIKELSKAIKKAHRKHD